MNTPMCTCEAAMAQLWDYLDEELTEDRYAVVEEHLRTCAHCFPHVEFAQRFLAALASCRHAGTMPEAVRESVMNSLKREGLVQGN